MICWCPVCGVEIKSHRVCLKANHTLRFRIINNSVISSAFMLFMVVTCERSLLLGHFQIKPLVCPFSFGANDSNFLSGANIGCYENMVYDSV